jgi:hypothetical protein
MYGSGLFRRKMTARGVGKCRRGRLGRRPALARICPLSAFSTPKRKIADVACGIQRNVKNSVNGACLASGHDEGGSREMSFYATFVKFRAKDNPPVPVSLPVQLSARTTGEAVTKLEQLRAAGRWPALADAVRLFKDGKEADMFAPVFDAAA